MREYENGFVLRLRDVVVEALEYVYGVRKGLVNVVVQKEYDNVYRHAFDVDCKTWDDAARVLEDVGRLAMKAAELARARAHEVVSLSKARLAPPSARFISR